MHSLHREPAVAAAGGPVCVCGQGVSMPDLRLPEYNGRVKCAQTIFQSVWPSPAISLSITLSTPSHPSSLNMQQISPSHTQAAEAAKLLLILKPNSKFQY